MRIHLILRFAIVAALSVGTASADVWLKREPGLWEIKMNQGSPMAAMMQSLPGLLDSIPAEQRKQMEAMMGKSGLSVAKPNVIKQCLTPEMAARDFEPYIDEDPDTECKTSSKKLSKNSAEFSYTCNTPDGVLNGKGRIWDATSKAYKSEMIMEGTIEGQPVKMDMGHEGRWVSSDCQGIEPIKIR